MLPPVLIIKCRNYYCVPFKYTCDGKNDCPMGDDEQSCVNRTCPGLFKCQNSIRCLHYQNVEDGIKDCQNGDDEIFKGLSACPVSCLCLMSAVTCMDISTNSWKDDHKTFLYISITKSSIHPDLLHFFPYVIILKLPDNHLHSFCTTKAIHMYIIQVKQAGLKLQDSHYISLWKNYLH